ncbi:uncharacterized protein CBL_08844 [Carabus blaptoides fortunei]
MEMNGGNIPQRSSEEISTILAHAKLKQEDFMTTTQILYINGENAKSDQYKLLELDNHLLEAIKTNSTIVFKGTDEDSIVLCTDTCTYDVRECETSNSLFLVPELKNKLQVSRSSASQATIG